MTPSTVGILGAGTMGTGIAQLAATHGNPVVLYDTSKRALKKSREQLERVLTRLREKGRLEPGRKREILDLIQITARLDGFESCALVIEAIIEDLSMKKAAFRRLEKLAPDDCLLATNTSSLSITSIASVCRHPQRVVGMHFFNPAPVMKLVELVPGMLTEDSALRSARRTLESWEKTVVVATDTPGFVVNRVARPFYGEALRMFEENLADAVTIDWAMRELAGFRMGPFELMDLIGLDVNYAVSERVFEAFYYDPRFRPSSVQRRMVEAGLLGRKSGRGYYDYTPGAETPEPQRDPDLGGQIVQRILVMLINEAADAVLHKVASPSDIDLAMTRGVNYPKGLLAWADELGLRNVVDSLKTLQSEYGEDRYRPNVLLKRMARNHQQFFDNSQ